MMDTRNLVSFDVDQLLKELTLEQKIKLLSGKDSWHTYPIPDKNVPSIRVSDGPNGLRGTKFFNGVPSACFPCGTGMAATFDHELLRQAGELMAQEAKAKGAHVILGPTINIQRSPLGGRGFESFSEDPVLSGNCASDVINGMQSKGIQATIKHFIGNDQEDERRAVDAQIPQRALREIYLMPFQIALRDSNPSALMSSYNKVNGTHVAENTELLKGVLRDEWQYKGMVMSDWYGTYSTDLGIKAGNNLEMPGPAIWRGERLEDAVHTRKVGMNDIDENVRHVLNLVKKAANESGLPENAPEGENNNASTSKTLRQLAADSIVVLKNSDSVLPLKKSSKTAVIGPNALTAAYCGGGSASMAAYYTVSPLEGVAGKVTNKPTSTIGVDVALSLPLIGEQLTNAEGKKGFTFHCYDAPQSDASRKLVDTLHLTNSYMFMADYKPEIGDKDTFFIDIEGYFTPEEDAEYEFGCIVNGTAWVYIDDELVVDNATKQRQGTAFMGSGTIEETGKKFLKAGQRYKYTTHFGGAKTSKLGKSATVIFGGGMRLGVRKVISAEEELNRAITLAKEADQVVLVVGLTSEFESEGFDREHMDMPDGTDNLVEKILEANPNTVVVVQSGTPVTLPWTEKASTIVQAWYGGNENGNGLADVLFGDVNPSGKLPLSYPKRVEDNPAFFNYKSENGVTVYGENVYVGYRYYETVKRDVLFPFGHGLSYTTFEYDQVQVQIDADRDLLVATVQVTNTGKLAGKESVQIYVSQDKPSIRRPVKELKGYAKIDLAPGETKTAAVTLSLKYATSFWDDSRDQWISEQGGYAIHAASSSDSVKSTAAFTVSETKWWSGI